MMDGEMIADCTQPHRRCRWCDKARPPNANQAEDAVQYAKREPISKRITLIVALRRRQRFPPSAPFRGFSGDD